MSKPVIACSVVLVAAIPVATVQAVLATAASSLFESMPFILAGAALAVVSPAFGRRMVEFLGCGCGSGPSARSIPATAAAWLTLGPQIALARFGAATFLAKARLRAGPQSCADNNDLNLLHTLWDLLPCVLCAGVLLHIVSLYIDAPRSFTLPLAVLSGVGLGFFTSPCALGTVALAAVLSTIQPFAASGFLAVAGIADLRTMLPRANHTHRPTEQEWNDPLAYALCAFACAAAALHHGATLVNPRFTPALWICAARCGWLAWGLRTFGRNVRAQLAPALMIVGLLLGAPAPVYHATETTLTNAFAGEHVDFTGMVSSRDGHAALVRYAILCCRADAQPIAIRLRGQLRLAAGNWVRASGTIVTENGQFALQVHDLAHVSAPVDPFVYR